MLRRLQVRRSVNNKHEVDKWNRFEKLLSQALVPSLSSGCFPVSHSTEKSRATIAPAKEMCPTGIFHSVLSLI